MSVIIFGTDVGAPDAGCERQQERRRTVMADQVVVGKASVVGAGTSGATPPSSRPVRHPLVGLGVALASAAAFATSGAFGKSLLTGGWSPGAVVTMRIPLAALVLLGPALWSLRGRWGALRRNGWVV